MGFRAGRSAVDLSIGGTAADLAVPSIEDLSGNGVGGVKSKHSHCRLFNSHATQTLFVKFGAVATVSSFDAICEPLDELVINLPPNNDRVSLIASGAATTVSAQFGIAN